MKKYLSEIMKEEENKLEDGQNYMIVSPVGSGKTYYILKELCKDKKVLYLCDNSNLEAQVLLNENTTSHKDNTKLGFSKDNIEVMTYSYFGKKIKFDIDDEFVRTFDMIICDEVHNLIAYQEFDDSKYLYNAILRLLKKHEGVQTIFFTATPYNLNKLAEYNEGIDKHFKTLNFNDNLYINRYINKRLAYINNISQIQFALSEYKEGFIHDGLKCLIYVNKISDMRFIERMCLDRELNPMCIWSVNNTENYMSYEQNRVRDNIIQNGELLDPYNVLIINRSFETGVNITDSKLQLVIVNTISVTQQIQARGRIRHDVDLLIVKTKESRMADIVTIDEEYLNKEITKEDIFEIICKYKLKDSNSKILTVNKFSDLLIDNEYNIVKKRKLKNGKRTNYYTIKKNKIKMSDNGDSI